MNESPLVEIEVWVHVETDMAMLVSLPDRDAPKIWLAKTMVVVADVRRGHRSLAYAAEIMLPEALAKDRGLI